MEKSITACTEDFQCDQDETKPLCNKANGSCKGKIKIKN